MNTFLNQKFLGTLIWLWLRNHLDLLVRYENGSIFVTVKGRLLAQLQFMYKRGTKILNPVNQW